jgi:hypothetical protein
MTLLLLSLSERIHETISEFSENDLDTIQIVRSERATKTLGEFLQRCNYHESVHAGQSLSYLRTVGMDDIYQINDARLQLGFVDVLPLILKRF